MARQLSEAFGGLTINPAAPPGRTKTMKSTSSSSSGASVATAVSAASASASASVSVSSSAAELGIGRKSSSSKRGDRLVVGVDFGTTFSGVAAVYSGTPDDIEVIKTWPGGNGITSDKVPTEISYTPLPPRPPYPAGGSNSTPPVSTHLPPSPSSPKFGSANTLPPITTSSPRWGFQASPTAPRLRCLKLFLDRQHKLPSYISPLETVTLLRSVNKTVLDAIGDYLSALHAHTIDTLTRRYGGSFMESTPIEWVLTVPAVWSDAAKNATRVAAERAGMTGGGGGKGGIRLISEPEAAAVYTLRAIQPNSLAVGDHFVVCDAGGGTVDLISYEIAALVPSLLLQESSIGTGGLCGSVLLNYAFEEHCRKRLGEGAWAGLRPKSRAMGVRYWDEYVKRNFKYVPPEQEGEDGEEEEEMSIPFPGLPDDEAKGVEGGFMLMGREEVKAIFEPVVGEVVKLCQEQVEGIRSKGGKVTGIVLVGGFGQSNYLYNRLKDHFRTTTTTASAPGSALVKVPSIEVMQPLYAWTAVVRGAVIRGLEGSMVVTRKARCHYGTSYATVWEEGIHPVKDRYWSPLWERYMVNDRMEWHITRGQPVSDLTPISFHYTRNFSPGQSLIVEDELLVCTSDAAPTNMSPEVASVCTLRTDLTAVPRTEFTRLATSKGVEYWSLDFCLEIVVESAGLWFGLRVGEVKYASVTATFH